MPKGSRDYQVYQGEDIQDIKDSSDRWDQEFRDQQVSSGPVARREWLVGPGALRSQACRAGPESRVHRELEVGLVKQPERCPASRVSPATRGGLEPKEVLETQAYMACKEWTEFRECRERRASMVRQACPALPDSPEQRDSPWVQGHQDCPASRECQDHPDPRVLRGTSEVEVTVGPQVPLG